MQDTASTLAKTLISSYNPSDVGVLPAPYFWWEGGAMWGGLIDYWRYTGDASYNDAVTKAMVSQAGSSGDFMGPSAEVCSVSPAWTFGC